MKCPKCKNMDSKVVDSRMIEAGQVVRRRRECEFCTYRFTTFERAEMLELLVIKRDGSKEIYDRSKLKRAILLAFAKRQIQPEVIDTMINNLELKRQSLGTEILTTKI